MSGGAHHNPHGRQGQPNSAWNHLQVPNFFPRQPQLAHMSSDRPLSLSPLTWHTPTTTEPPTKNAPGPLYNLQQMMLAEPRSVQQNPLDNIALAARDRLEGLGISLNRQTSLEAIQSFSRHVALPASGMGSVDLTLSRSAPSPHSLSCSPSMIRNGQNGESGGPISLSVRDTKQINSMDTAELNKLQMGRSLDIINTSPGVSQRSNSPKSPKPFKRSAKKMDSILERLNSAPADLCSASRQSPGVLVQPICEDNSSQQSHEARLTSPASTISVVPMLTSTDVHVPSALATDDCTESVDKLRHKRKPDKTTRIEKEDKESEMVLDISNQTSITINRVEVPSEKTQLIGNTRIPDSTKVTMLVQSIQHIKESANEMDSLKKSDPVIELNSVLVQDSKLNAAKLIKPSEISNQGNSINTLKEPESVQKDFIEYQEPTLKTVPISNLLATNTSKTDNSSSSIQELPVSVKQDHSQPTHTLDMNSITKTGTLTSNVPIIKRRSSNEESHVIPCKVRRKTCSESETIDNIAAMIASGDDVPVIVPKNMNNENNAIKDLAHVLAGPLNDEDLSVASTNNIENKDHSKDEQNQNKINIPSENKDSNMITETTQGIPQDNNHTTNFVQVENELEKMFAGIDETQTCEVEKTNEGTLNPRDNVTSTSNENKPKRKLSNTAVRASRKSSDSAENTPKKKNPETAGNKKTPSSGRSKGGKAKGGKNQNTQKNAKLKAKLQDPAIKDILTYDSGSNASSNKSRGPFVQIKGPRDSPISVSIINTSTNDEDPENRMKQTKTKKHHDDAEFRHKMRKGLHSSTLSMKYDATTTDVTWVCVFCKNGPHCGGTNLGDLFGPYLVTTACPEFQYSQQNPEDDPFKSKRTKQDMIARNILNANNKQPVKRKRSSHSESLMADIDIYAGMVEASPGAYEVWGHEECIIWAPGVYLVGSRVIGLEGAVWSSCRAKCCICNLTGANVGCSQRGCDKFAHISCAPRNDWSILEDVYKATCPIHHST